eukprot:scaffold126648_cov31-Tisochrysis_lutea.AAC.1
MGGRGMAAASRSTAAKKRWRGRWNEVPSFRVQISPSISSTVGGSLWIASVESPFSISLSLGTAEDPGEVAPQMLSLGLSASDPARTAFRELASTLVASGGHGAGRRTYRLLAGRSCRTHRKTESRVAVATARVVSAWAATTREA